MEYEVDSLCAMSFKNNAIRRARECFAFFVLPLWPSKSKAEMARRDTEIGGH